MRRLARSLTRFSVASTLYGAERMAHLLRGRSRSATAESLDTVTESAASGMSELAHALFHAGDAFGREWLDLSAEALESGKPDRLFERLVARSTDGLRFASFGSEGRAARAELVNKVKVYQWVRRARERLGEDLSSPPPPLARTMEKLRAMDPNSALWLVEGVGYRCAHWRLNVEPTGEPGLFHDLDAQGVPERWQPILHAGLGLAIARGQLDALASRIEGRHPDERAVGQRLHRILEWGRIHADPRFRSTTFESLGMVSRYFHPSLVVPLDRTLRHLGPPTEGEPPWRTLFWHGCGRGLYFAPIQMVPAYGSLERALEAAAEEAPTDQLDAYLAGLGYAFALVNLAAPEVIESTLLRRVTGMGAETGTGGLADTAFATGLAGALCMRRTITPDSPELDALLAHRPDASIRSAWQRVIVDSGVRITTGFGRQLYDELHGQLPRDLLRDLLREPADESAEAVP